MFVTIDSKHNVKNKRCAIRDVMYQLVSWS